MRWPLLIVVVATFLLCTFSGLAAEDGADDGVSNVEENSYPTESKVPVDHVQRRQSHCLARRITRKERLDLGDHFVGEDLFVSH